MRYRISGKPDFLPVGRLGLKQEPAGKVRVFAMVDALRQRILHPFHEWAMDILRELPTDGTYDQLAPILRLLSKHSIRNYWCFDLTSATDRMPLGAYRQFWSDLFGEELSRLWCVALSGHRFVVPRQWGVPHTDPNGVQFKVGQPLGALSSWPTFSLVHHLLIQRSAQNAGMEGIFWNYAILGDDLVIGHPEVAFQYEVLTNVFGCRDITS